PCQNRDVLRRAATVVAGAVLVVAIAAAGLFLWLARYAPLHALDSGFAPGPGIGADVQPVTGSGGRPVYFPAVRGSGRFDAAFTRTRTVRLPFAVTLRCVGGPPANP